MLGGSRLARWIIGDGDDGDHRGHDQTDLEVTTAAVGDVDQQLALSTICPHTGHLWTP
jgi:hypothetical protein